MWRAAKTDANAPELDAALGAVGCSIMKMDALGNGWPDRCIGRDGKNYLLEYKSEHGELTPLQVKRFGEWRGDPVHVVRTAAEALAAVGLQQVA